MFRSMIVAGILTLGLMIGSDSTGAQTAQTGKTIQKTPAAAGNRKQADQWALLIGVNDYPGEIQDLRFARDDARAIRDLLISSVAMPTTMSSC
ncbi:MAG: hypothetical protein IPM55_07175 [Acidobacteria bacterium]|nr:hypothetical protein [Acidobacteriota bacterium]